MLNDEENLDDSTVIIDDELILLLSEPEISVENNDIDSLDIENFSHSKSIATTVKRFSVKFENPVSSGGFRSTVTKGTPSSSALTATCTNGNLVSSLGSNSAPKIRLTNGKHSIGFKLNNIIENKTSGSAQAGPTYFIKQYFTQL